jgi:hypothetical protein
MDGLRPLTKRETKVIEAFERAMRTVTIPEILRERREREEAWQRIKDLVLD